jgi:hypothetical protein
MKEHFTTEPISLQVSVRANQAQCIANMNTAQCIITFTDHCHRKLSLPTFKKLIYSRPTG